MEPVSVTDRVAVVIPTLNEAESITGVISGIPRMLVHEIIVADSMSDDGTATIAAAAGAAAAQAECGIIVFMDGDGSDRADLMPLLLAPIQAGTHDFVIGSRVRGVREKGAMSWHQVLAGRLLGGAIGVLTGVRYTDMCAFRAISRDALERLRLREMTYGWNIEMQMQAARAGLRILEIPLPYRRRAGGHSKVAGSLRGSLRAGWRIGVTFVRVAVSARPA
jgi:glycosyltransferase involved in cell wall biosynthesis